MRWQDRDRPQWVLCESPSAAALPWAAPGSRKLLGCWVWKDYLNASPITPQLCSGVPERNGCTKENESRNKKEELQNLNTKRKRAEANDMLTLSHETSMQQWLILGDFSLQPKHNYKIEKASSAFVVTIKEGKWAHPEWRCWWQIMKARNWNGDKLCCEAHRLDEYLLQLHFRFH